MTKVLLVFTLTFGLMALLGYGNRVKASQVDKSKIQKNTQKIGN